MLPRAHPAQPGKLSDLLPQEMNPTPFLTVLSLPARLGFPVLFGETLSRGVCFAHCRRYEAE